MGSICGWMGPLHCDAAPTTVIAGMTASLPGLTVSSATARVEPSAALFVAPPGEGGHGEMGGQVWVAIEGRPRWSSADLAALAEQEGHAAALKAAYHRFDLGLLERLSGPFALAIIDNRKDRLLLTIDRFGSHRMCYSALARGGVAFGATTDAVRAHPAVSATVPAQAVFDFLYFGACPSPTTIYREQRKLLPAQYLLSEKGKVRTDFYWQMRYAPNQHGSLNELTDELFSTLRRSVSRAVAGVSPSGWGTFLSGGLDSSTVTGLLAELSDEPVKAFTIGFKQDRYDEMEYARVAAQHFGCRHYQYYLRPEDVVDGAQRISAHFDEPFGNSSVFPTYYCAKLAKDHGVRLMLAGDGGDEIFAGNSRYVDQKIFEIYLGLPSMLRSLVIEPIVLGFPERAVPRLLCRARNYIHYAKIPLPNRLEAWNFYQLTPPAELFLPDRAAEIAAEAPVESLREAYFRTPAASTLQRMLHLDLKITLADNDLRKVSGACQLAGLLVEFPFLDRDVVEFSGRVPPHLLIQRFQRRYFFKRAMRGFLPPTVIAKTKHGFGMPHSEWPRENPALRELACDCIAGFKRRHYLKPEFLDRIIESASGQTDQSHHERVWDIMMLELWFRHRDSLQGGHARLPSATGLERGPKSPK